jgi:hypothetical protein
MLNPTLSRALLLSLVFVAVTAHANGLTGTPADFGARATAAIPVDQRIVLTPGTKVINVNNGDTVEFVVGGKTFRWHFDTFLSEANFPLSRIAPADVPADGIKVYVAANPIYRGH